MLERIHRMFTLTATVPASAKTGTPPFQNLGPLKVVARLWGLAGISRCRVLNSRGKINWVLFY